MNTQISASISMLRGLLCVLLSIFVLTLSITAQVTVEMTPGVTTAIGGTVQIPLTGNWLNTGTLQPGTSLLELLGTEDQTLRQNLGAFYNVTVDKTSGNVQLASDVNIYGGHFNISSGDLALTGYHLIFDPEAFLTETPGNTAGGSTGYLTTTRLINAPVANNIAGLGLTLSTTENLGLTEIRRGHAPQTSNGTDGIARYFDVLAQFNTNGTASLVFHYDDSELNLNTESTLALYRSEDDGTNWVQVPGTLNTAANTFQANDIITLSRYTLSSHCLETCIATVARATGTTLSLNASGTITLDPQVLDDGSTGACGIDHLTVSPNAFDCDDIGSQEVLFAVTDAHGCSSAMSVMIDVVDDTPPAMVCHDITITLGEGCTYTVDPSEIDNGSSDACGISLSVDPAEATFTCDDFGLQQLTLTGTDPSGNTAQCMSHVFVQITAPEVECQDVTITLEQTSFHLQPGDIMVGEPGDFPGYTFSVSPAVFGCSDLGEHEVILTATDYLGNVSTCMSLVTFIADDEDCDGVMDPCDVCPGGDDLQDTDGDGIPDCADWDGYFALPQDWQCSQGLNLRVILCHNGVTTCVRLGTVAAHLGHGDFLGPCDDAECGGIEVLLGTIEENSPQENLSRTKDLDSDTRPAGIASTEGVVLAGNVPNPFTGETLIRYYLPEDDDIVLTVYDLMGNTIEVITQGMQSTGWHQSTFDGTKYPGGVYLCHLQTSVASLTRPMVLSK